MKTIIIKYLKIIILSILILCFCVLSVFSQFYTNYSDAERKKLAEAYYLVGKQYQSLEKPHGQNYINLAYVIYPGLVPEDIKDEYYETDLLEEIAPEDNSYQNNVKLIRYRFERMVAFFLARDTENVTSFLDSQIYNSDFDLMLSKEELAEALDEIYDYMEITDKYPDAIYNIEDMSVTAVEGSLPGDTVFELTVNAKSLDYSQYLPFWRHEQKFYWHMDIEEKWMIFAINKQPPAEKYSTAREETRFKREILTDVKACIQAFIDKDLAGVSAYLYDEVELIPLNTVVKKSEIEYTFTGYFDETGTLEIEDVDDLMENIAVNYNQEYSDKYSGTIYLVEIEIKSEYTTGISFWAAYKKYYMLKTDTKWKIIAIG